MKCIYCGYQESKVLDTRPTEESVSIRRRRECLSCGKRFTTYEIVEKTPLIVIKRDKSRETFDRNKLINGIVKACEKRPVTYQQIERIANDVETSLQNSMERETPTEQIGNMVMEALKPIDEIAYVRFASVYRQFKDVRTFIEEINKLLDNEK